MLFTLGLIVGLLIACFIAILSLRYTIPIQRNMSKLLKSPLIMSPHNSAYIAGFSDEESAFAATLPIDKEVHIV